MTIIKKLNFRWKYEITNILLRNTVGATYDEFEFRSIVVLIIFLVRQIPSCIFDDFLNQFFFVFPTLNNNIQ